jgi:hypothetical protein
MKDNPRENGERAKHHKDTAPVFSIGRHAPDHRREGAIVVDVR